MLPFSYMLGYHRGMSTHYFRACLDEKDSGLRHFSFTVKDRSFSWTSLGGVFSCKKADQGGLLLLESLLDAELADGEFLDLGCGHGQVGLPLAALRPGLSLTLLDVNPQAVLSARSNQLRLGLSGPRLLVSDGLTALRAGGLFHGVALNPPVRAGRLLVHRLADEAWARLRSGGHLFVVLRVKQGAWRFLDHMIEAYDEDAHAVLRHKGYVVMAARRSEEEGEAA